MDTHRFVEGYRNPAYHTVAHTFERHKTPQDAELNAVMEGPRKWTSFFDRQLVLHLKGEHTDANDGYTLFKGLYDYERYFLNNGLLDDALESAIAIAESGPDAPSAVNELNFHTLNKEMLPVWHRLFFGAEMMKLDTPTVTDMQTRLAVASAGIQEHYQTYTSEGDKKMITRLGGQLTEIDSAIVLLEIMKRTGDGDDTSFIAVPAPPRFESAIDNHDRQADFLFFDVLKGEVRGIQVKTKISGDETGYDRDYITVIDGMTDLGNSTADYKAFRGMHTSPAPGLLALDFLKNNTVVAENESPSLVDARHTAETVFADRKPYFDQAIQYVGERVLFDLYKQPAPAPVEEKETA